ncbi:hypothetical protein [Streptomyces sp. NPDC005262]
MATARNCFKIAPPHAHLNDSSTATWTRAAAVVTVHYPADPVLRLA